MGFDPSVVQAATAKTSAARPGTSSCFVKRLPLCLLWLLSRLRFFWLRRLCLFHRSGLRRLGPGFRLWRFLLCLLRELERLGEVLLGRPPETAHLRFDR